MSGFHLVDPQGWEYDLQSVYSAYIGYFQLHCVAWHDRTWGHFFETFEQFLAFSWPVVTVTDAYTGRAHIVTRMTSIAAFLRMIKTRFGETLPQVDNILLVKPFETSQRHLRHVSDWTTYKKLHAALPAVALAAFKARVKSGDPKAIRELWAGRNKTFLTIDFECLGRNDDRSCIEWGYAALRCEHLEAAGAWPPVPDTNYRKGHYIIAEYAGTPSKVSPNVGWQYAFGDSQVIPKAKLPRIIQSVLSLVSPDSEALANNLVLVGHGIGLDIQRMEEMKIKLPSNVLTIDVALLERAIFATGERGPMADRKTGKPRAPNVLLSLAGLINSLGVGNEQPARCVLNNAGNDAFMMLVAFQKMVEPRGTAVGPVARGSSGAGSVTGRAVSPTPSPIYLSPFGLGAHVNATATMPRLRSGGGAVAVNGGVDELGGKRRASMFSALTSPRLLPVDKKRETKDTSGRASPLGSSSMSGVTVNGNGSASGHMHQRRDSAGEKRR